MNYLKNTYFLSFLLTLGLLSCDDEINYDDFQEEVTIIEDAETFTTRVDGDNLTVEVDALANILGGNENTNSLFYDINWGDGSPVERTTTGKASHIYAAPREYTITVEANADGLLKVTKSKLVAVGLITGLVITPEADVDDPSLITLTTSAQNATTYTINWGDDSPVQESTTGVETHRYQASGNYTITVTASAPGRDSISRTRIVTIVAGGIRIFINNTFEGNDFGGFAQDPGVSLAPGCTGQGLNLNGRNSTQFDFPEPIPVEGKINIEYNFSTTNAFGTFSSVLINNPVNAGDNGRIQLNINNGEIEYKISTGGENVELFQGGVIENNECYAVRIEIDKENNKVKFFLDGEQQGDAEGYDIQDDFQDTLFNTRLITFADPMNPTPDFNVDNFKISTETEGNGNAILLNEKFDSTIGGFAEGAGVSFINSGCGEGAVNVNGKNSTQWDFASPFEGSVAIEYDFRTSNAFGTFSSFLVNQPEGNNNGRIQININNGQLEYKIGTGGANPTVLGKTGTIDNNLCYAMRIEIDRDAQKIKFFLDGEQQGDVEGYDLEDDFQTEINNIKLITFVDPMNPTPDFTIDNLKISEL